MQVAGNRALGFDADAPIAVGRCAGQAVGADKRRLTVALDLHRYMLPGGKCHSGTGGRLEVERTDIAALLLYPEHPPGLPLVLLLTLLQTRIGLGPGAGHQAGGGVLLERPAQGNRSRPPHHLVDLQRPQPLCTFERLDGRAFQQHLGTPAHLQHVAVAEVDEQQTCPRVDQQVAQGVEVQVTGVVGNGQRIALDPDESWPTATVGHIHRTLAVVMLDIAGDEEGVGRLDHTDGRGIQGRRIDAPLGRFGDARVIAQLDVLRAVAERLLYRHLQLPCNRLANLPVEAVAPAGVQFDAQQADCLPGDQARGRRVIGR